MGERGSTLGSSLVGRYSGGSVSSLSPVLIHFSSTTFFSCKVLRNQNVRTASTPTPKAVYLHQVLGLGRGRLGDRLDVLEGVRQGVQRVQGVCTRCWLDAQKRPTEKT